MDDTFEVPDEALETTTSDGWIISHWLHENQLSLWFGIADEQDADDEISFSGWISFDGCINWRTDPFCYAHSCGSGDLAKFRRAFETIEGLAAERMPAWCG